MPMGAPCQKFWHGKGEYIRVKLPDDEVVDRTEIGRLKSHFGEHHIDAVHAEGDFVFEPGEVGLFETGTIADDEGAFPFMNILQLRKAADAFPAPGMKIGGGQLRHTADSIVGVARKIDDGYGQNRFQGLFPGLGKYCLKSGMTTQRISRSSKNESRKKRSTILSRLRTKL